MKRWPQSGDCADRVCYTLRRLRQETNGNQHTRRIAGKSPARGPDSGECRVQDRILPAAVDRLFTAATGKGRTDTSADGASQRAVPETASPGVANSERGPLLSRLGSGHATGAGRPRAHPARPKENPPGAHR